MLDYVNYNQNGKRIRSALPGFTNVTTDVARTPRAEIMYRSGVTDDVRRRMRFRSDQKSIKLLTRIIQKFTTPCDLVNDTSVGTLSVAKACILLPKQMQIILAD